MSTTLAIANGKPVTSEILDRQPPRDLGAEKGVLGSILLKPEICGDVLTLVSADDFYDEANQKLFGHFMGIHGSGAKPDLVLVTNRLNASGDYDDIGGAGYLADVAQSVPHAGNVKQYASIVRDLAGKRQFIFDTCDLMQDAYNGVTTDTLLNLATERLAKIRRRTNLADRPAIVGLTKLIANDAGLREPIIDGIIRRGETANIIAAPKVGKSWLGYGLAITVSIGGVWLGQFECRPGRVLYIDNELHLETLTHRFPAVAHALGVRQDDYADRLDVLSLRGRLTDLHGVARLLEAVEPGRYDLAIFDALYRGLPEGTSENDNASMAGLFNLIDKTSDRLGCCWVNIHHSSKGDQGHKSVVDVGAGAGSQARAADAHIVLRPHETEGAVVMEAVVRSFKPIKPMSLRWTFPVWTPDDGLDTTAVKGRLTKAEERQNEKNQQFMAKVRDALLKGPATPKILRGLTGMSDKPLQRILDLMESQEMVTWTTIQKRGNETREYQLTPEDE
jgi:hypothetical protein